MNRLEKLLSTLLSPFQEWDNVAIEVLTERSVDTAVGVQLDTLGKIVGQIRAGASDDVYRRYIRARIATNRSTGKREELISITRMILGTTSGSVLIRTESTGSYILEIQDIPVDDAVAAALLAMLSAATPLGVRIVVDSSPRPVSQVFRFDVGPGWDIGHLARGEDNT